VKEEGEGTGKPSKVIILTGPYRAAAASNLAAAASELGVGVEGRGARSIPVYVFGEEYPWPEAKRKTPNTATKMSIIFVSFIRVFLPVCERFFLEV
jgi:hypothetical protein